MTRECPGRGVGTSIGAGGERVVAMLRPARLGLEPRVAFDPEPVAASAAELAFFQALERQGNAGPLLELPMQAGNLTARSRRVLLSAPKPAEQALVGGRPAVVGGHLAASPGSSLTGVGDPPGIRGDESDCTRAPPEPR